MNNSLAGSSEGSEALVKCLPGCGARVTQPNVAVGHLRGDEMLCLYLREWPPSSSNFPALCYEPRVGLIYTEKRFCSRHTPVPAHPEGELWGFLIKGFIHAELNEPDSERKMSKRNVFGFFFKPALTKGKY